jgi:hypothetical protein
VPGRHRELGGVPGGAGAPGAPARAARHQAEQCNSGNCYVFTPTSADEAVQALDALKIINSGSLVVEQPANNPSCYNLPCDSDRQAADQENQRRAVVTFTIANYLKLQGI